MTKNMLIGMIALFVGFGLAYNARKLPKLAGTDNLRFVEQADLSKAVASDAVSDATTKIDAKLNVAVFGRTMRPTPPPTYVWLGKRTSLNGEGTLAARQ